MGPCVDRDDAIDPDQELYSAVYCLKEGMNCSWELITSIENEQV
jgi:hypothetical protein